MIAPPRPDRPLRYASRSACDPNTVVVVSEVDTFSEIKRSRIPEPHHLPIAADQCRRWFVPVFLDLEDGPVASSFKPGATWRRPAPPLPARRPTPAGLDRSVMVKAVPLPDKSE
jgi:hypothetical protein